MAANMNEPSIMGMRSEGDLHVMMDLGLAEVVRMPVDQLRQRMQTVIELQKQVEDLQSRDENVRKEFSAVQDALDVLNQRYRDRENDEDTDEPDEEPGIALEDQLRITEQSAKAIDLLSSHMLSTVWQTCSKNTFGEYNLYKLTFIACFI